MSCEVGKGKGGRGVRPFPTAQGTAARSKATMGQQGSLAVGLRLAWPLRGSAARLLLARRMQTRAHTYPPSHHTHTHTYDALDAGVHIPAVDNVLHFEYLCLL